jgi:5'-nucleotidase
MAVSLSDKLVVAISSRALFDFEEENRVFETGDLRDYEALQRERLNVPAQPGVAFALIQKLLALNSSGNSHAHHVEVVILSRSDPISGLRTFNSCREHKLDVQRGVFTRGREPWRYLRPLNASLFLSANSDDVRGALDAGFPAARVFPESATMSERNAHEIRIAFDGDAVLFSDEAEQIFQREGLSAFVSHERDNRELPLAQGPLKPLLEALNRLQKLADANTAMRIRTALVTARSAPAHERAIRTLMAWNIEIDEAMFLGGLDKGPFLREFEPDFFFDDQIRHCESARSVTATGHVASGVANPTSPADPLDANRTARASTTSEASNDAPKDASTETSAS